MVFHFFVLASVVVNEKASTEADVMSKTDGVLKHDPDKIGGHKDHKDIKIGALNKTGDFNTCDANNSTFFIEIEYSKTFLKHGTQGLFYPFVGCDYCTQSSVLSFEKNIFIKHG